MTKLIRTKLLPDNAGFCFIPGVVLLGVDASNTVVKHELRHKEQQQRDGWLMWTLHYVFSPACRFEYEAEAYAVSVKEKLTIVGSEEDLTLTIYNQASNLLHYNVWHWMGPTEEQAAQAIRVWYDIIKYEK
jgi:hypothetical protein